MPRTYSITFQPGDEIVHVIAKNFNPVNRAEFNPGVENAPCNRPLIGIVYVLFSMQVPTVEECDFHRQFLFDEYVAISHRYDLKRVSLKS